MGEKQPKSREVIERERREAAVLGAQFADEAVSILEAIKSTPQNAPFIDKAFNTSIAQMVHLSDQMKEVEKGSRSFIDDFDENIISSTIGSVVSIRTVSLKQKEELIHKLQMAQNNILGEGLDQPVDISLSPLSGEQDILAGRVSAQCHRISTILYLSELLLSELHREAVRFSAVMARIIGYREGKRQAPTPEDLELGQEIASIKSSVALHAELDKDSKEYKSVAGVTQLLDLVEEFTSHLLESLGRER